MELKAGERVVYPNQGICRVLGVKAQDIGGHRAEFVQLVRERDGATVLVPAAKVAEVGIRPIGTRPEAERALERLSDTDEEPILDWKTRQREHLEKMTRGGLVGMADVLRSLFTLSLMRPLPQREREMYDQVRALLIEEASHILDLPGVSIEDQIDLALAPPEGRGAAQRRLRARTAERQIEAARQREGGEEPDEDEDEDDEALEAPAPKRPASKAAKAPKKAPSKKPASKPAAASGKKTAAKRPTSKKKAPTQKAAKKPTPKKKSGR